MNYRVDLRQESLVTCCRGCQRGGGRLFSDRRWCTCKSSHSKRFDCTWEYDENWSSLLAMIETTHSRQKYGYCFMFTDESYNSSLGRRYINWRLHACLNWLSQASASSNSADWWEHLLVLGVLHLRIYSCLPPKCEQIFRIFPEQRDMLDDPRTDDLTRHLSSNFEFMQRVPACNWQFKIFVDPSFLRLYENCEEMVFVSRWHSLKPLTFEVSVHDRVILFLKSDVEREERFHFFMLSQTWNFYSIKKLWRSNSSST